MKSAYRLRLESTSTNVIREPATFEVSNLVPHEASHGGSGQKLRDAVSASNAASDNVLLVILERYHMALDRTAAWDSDVTSDSGTRSTDIR